jgi:hypothetical protein
MIVLDCVQGTETWLQGRIGRPTASGFDKIITPGGKASTQATAYMMKLAGEWLIGKPAESHTTDFMARGTELEPMARDAYSFLRDVDVEQVGLVYLDERRTVACSPDGLVKVNGGFEAKCPTIGVHVEYILGKGLPDKYKPQVQGNLWICGREWWDFLSFHPDAPPFLYRVNRDEKYIGTLSGMVLEFVDKLEGIKHQLKEAA